MADDKVTRFQSATRDATVRAMDWGDGLRVTLIITDKDPDTTHILKEADQIFSHRINGWAAYATFCGIAQREVEVENQLQKILANQVGIEIFCLEETDGAMVAITACLDNDRKKLDRIVHEILAYKREGQLLTTRRVPFYPTFINDRSNLDVMK